MQKAWSTTKSKGFSIVEIVLSVALFGLLVTALMGSFSYGQEGSQTGGDRARATALAQEGIQAMQSIRDEVWNEFTYMQSGVQISGGEWDFLGEGTTETIGDFTRTITFANVCRDGSDVIATCPSTYTDPHSKQVTVTVSWQSGVTAISHSVTWGPVPDRAAEQACSSLLKDRVPRKNAAIHAAIE